MISQVELANTFDVWRVKTNQLITIANDLKEGNLLSTGTISIDNSGGFEGNVALNVKSGLIQGDAGLLSNVGAPGSIKNVKLENAAVTVTATQGQIILSTGSLALGSTVYLNVANLTVNSNDVSVANIASANVVNAVHRIATVADIRSNLAFANANSAGAAALSAFETANAVNAVVTSMNTSVTTTLNLVSGINANSIAAHEKANLAFLASNIAYAQANAAYDQANTALAGINSKLPLSGGTITGDLIVQGNTYFTNTLTFNVADPLIILSANNIAGDTVDIGFAAVYNNGSSNLYTGFFRDATSKEYYVFDSYLDNPSLNDINTQAIGISTLNAKINTSNIVVSETLILGGDNVKPFIINVGAAANALAILAYAQANAAGGVGAPPNTALGANGDLRGTISISNNFIYVAANDWTDGGVTWKTIPLRQFEERTPYVMMPFFYGTPPPAAPLFFNAAPFPYQLPANLVGSIVIANTAPSGVATFTVYRNFANIGTIRFAAATKTATFNVAQTNFNTGDTFAIINSPAADGTISNIMLTIQGYRTT